MDRRRRLDKFVEPFVITASDGTRFRCSITAIGRETDPRWVLMDSTGAQFIGPHVEPDKSHEAVERLVSAWWESAKPVDKTKVAPAEQTRIAPAEPPRQD
jgi:hypothetical protein